MKSFILSVIALLLCIIINAQNVGVGEINPTESKLQVKAADSAALLIQNTATTLNTKTALFYKSDNNYSGSIATIQTSPSFYRMGLFTFGGATASGLKERISILDGGNVGIGTTNPTAKLEIAGTIKIADGSEGATKVLTSDAAGLASWSAAPVSDSSKNTGFWGQNLSNQPFTTSFLPVINSELFDDGNSFSGGLYTVPAAGLYQFNVNTNFIFSNVTSQSTIQIVIENTGFVSYGSQTAIIPAAFSGVSDIQAITIVKLPAGAQIRVNVNVYGTTGLQTLTSVKFRGCRIY
jgi:hypothetical protein